jgi:hypothetical protein
MRSVQHKHGKISGEQFEKVLVNTLSHRNLNELPPQIRDNLKQIAGYPSFVSHSELSSCVNGLR